MPLQLSPTPLEDALLPSTLHLSEVCDTLAAMELQEETTYAVKDYLADSVSLRKKASKPVDADCRVKMCEWCYQVVDFCKFRRETVGIGMSYLDRFLCTSRGREALCNRKEYQLAAMTALYIAIKLHEPLEMETSLLADLSRGCYNEMEFVHMEQTILLALNWRVNGPTALSYVQHYISFLPKSVSPTIAEAIFDYARYQTELALADQGFVAIRLADLGLAAVLNAMEGMDIGMLPLKTQGKFVRMLERYAGVDADDHIEHIQAKLSMLLVNLLAGDFAEILGPAEEESVDEYLEDHHKQGSTGNTLLKNSPVSVVIRR